MFGIGKKGPEKLGDIGDIDFDAQAILKDVSMVPGDDGSVRVDGVAAAQITKNVNEIYARSGVPEALVILQKGMDEIASRPESRTRKNHPFIKAASIVVSLTAAVACSPLIFRGAEKLTEQTYCGFISGISEPMYGFLPGNVACSERGK